MLFIPVPQEVFNRVQIDVMGPFTTSKKGNKYVVTAIVFSILELPRRMD